MIIQSVTEKVVEYLRTNIIIGNLKAGQKLEENQISSSIGVSRPPLREAFRILERERIVINIPRKGTFVSKISKAELLSVYEAREMVETYAIELLKRKGVTKVPEAEAALEMAVNMSVPSLDNIKEYLTYYKGVSDFHDKLIYATQNPWLIKFKYELSSTRARYRILNIQETLKNGSLDQSLNDHRKILSAMDNGDYEKAKEIMIAHVRRGLLQYNDIIQSI